MVSEGKCHLWVASKAAGVLGPRVISTMSMMCYFAPISTFSGLCLYYQCEEGLDLELLEGSPISKMLSVLCLGSWDSTPKCTIP